MSNKILDYSRDNKDQSVKINSNKFEYDLFDEEQNIIEKFIRVRRYTLPNNGEKWKIFLNNKILIVLEGIKFSEEEKKFLRSVEGVNFLIRNYKNSSPNIDEISLQINKKVNGTS